MGVIVVIGLAALVGAIDGDEQVRAGPANVARQPSQPLPGKEKELVGRWRAIEPFHTWSIGDLRISNGATFALDLRDGDTCSLSGFAYASVPAAHTSGTPCHYSIREGWQLVIEIDGKPHPQRLELRSDGLMALTADNRTALLQRMLLDVPSFDGCSRAYSAAERHQAASGDAAYRAALRAVADACGKVRLNVTVVGKDQYGCRRAWDVHLALGDMQGATSATARYRARRERSIAGDLPEEAAALDVLGRLYKQSQAVVQELC